jgi:hypothetical protein
VSQSCFDFVAAIFRLRKLLEFNKRFSQTKVCGYKKPNYDTVSEGRGDFPFTPQGKRRTLLNPLYQALGSS